MYVTVNCELAGAQRLLNNNNEVTLNARQILDQLNRAKEIPCILLPKETEETERIRLAGCQVCWPLTWSHVLTKLQMVDSCNVYLVHLCIDAKLFFLVVNCSGNLDFKNQFELLWFFFWLCLCLIGLTWLFCVISVSFRTTLSSLPFLVMEK